MGTRVGKCVGNDIILTEKDGCIEPQLFSDDWDIRTILKGWAICIDEVDRGCHLFHTCTTEERSSDYWNTDMEYPSVRKRKSCGACKKRIPKDVIELCHLLGMGT